MSSYKPQYIDCNYIKYLFNTTYCILNHCTYLFRGWYLDGTAYDFSTTVTENVTLEAVWEKIVFGEPDFILPAEIRMVEESAFEGVSPTVVYIPDGCQEFEPYAFRNCGNLNKVRIPAGCAIGEFAFEGCTYVYVFSVPGGGAEQYCQWHENCEFVPEGPESES